MDYQEHLRRLAIHDEAFVSLLLGEENPQVASALDARTTALVRVAATIAVDAAPSSFQHAVALAFTAGATNDEIVATLEAVTPVTGPLVRSFAPRNSRSRSATTSKPSSSASPRIGQRIHPIGMRKAKRLRAHSPSTNADNRETEVEMLGWWLGSILFIIIWVAIAFWPARVAARKGHSFFLYFLFSLVFFPAALLVAYMVSDRSAAATATAY
jgi:hypothetical protein